MYNYRILDYSNPGELPMEYTSGEDTLASITELYAELEELYPDCELGLTIYPRCA